MPKNIVICCDGTGNEYGNQNSNVVQLYQALIIDGKRQVGYYHPGVGTQGSPTSTNKVRATLSVIAGMAIGSGILDNVSDAYRYLMNVYEKGDNVYLFGFSRGAYTARAVAGVLHMFGLLCPGNEGLIPYVVRMYARRTRKAAGKVRTFDVAAGFKATFCRPCPLHLVGLWDTVSSIGWIWDPLKLPYTARNPDMAHGRHAISIDERRCYFRNNRWGEPFPGQDIKQVWFSGVHSDVGGSYPSAESGLSQITLQWMLCEAVSARIVDQPGPGQRHSRPRLSLFGSRPKSRSTRTQLAHQTMVDPRGLSTLLLRLRRQKEKVAYPSRSISNHHTRLRGPRKRLDKACDGPNLPPQKSATRLEHQPSLEGHRGA